MAMSSSSSAFWTMLLICMLCSCRLVLSAPPHDGWYDYSAYTDCRADPEPAQYGGGILKYNWMAETLPDYGAAETGVASPAFVVFGLNQTTKYSFSCWVKLDAGADSALITAKLSPDGAGAMCIGTVMARSGCWSFLKGGFVLDWTSQTGVIFFQNADKTAMKITAASASLQPFSPERWAAHQQDSIRKRRKRMVTVHAADGQGNRLVGANVTVEQISKDFPIGSAIASTILNNAAYQSWFVDRFNAAVFEDELKWYATEPVAGALRFDVPDQMLGFVRAHRVMVRGHNIFWENPDTAPAWVRALSGDDLRAAVRARIQGLMSRYRGEFAHWDVNNEMLHFNFYEQRLGANASLEFFDAAQDADPLATLFMNEFNVVETCADAASTVDTYVERLKELNDGGAQMEGIGLQGHFGKPNLPLMRAILDKLATLGLPIWFTEVDINNSFNPEMQGLYLEQVLREAYAHPAVNGIMLWTALHPQGCYQMCLTDWELKNTPAGDVVDKLLNEWATGYVTGTTDQHGALSFSGYLGEHRVCVNYGNRSAQATFSLSPGDETRHLNVQL